MREEKDMAAAKRFGCNGILIDRKGVGADFGQEFKVEDLLSCYRRVNL